MEMNIPLPKKIGLLADSHSHLDTLESAIHTLHRRGADTLVHLGDICDSLRLDLLEASIRLIKKYDVLAVKGNNDFMLETLLLGQPPEMTDDSTGPLLDFLQQLPMLITWGKICFSHSLPFDFLRAFYEPIDIGNVQRAEEVFRLTSHRILFCGHSHQPVLFHHSGQNVVRNLIPENVPVALDTNDRYIHVAGAVAEGECALFDSHEWCLERIRITGV